MNFVKNITYKILELQEKFLRKQLAKTLGAKNFSRKKRHYYGGTFVDLSSLADIEKQKLEEEILLILKQYEYSPEKILNYIENQGTKVIYKDKASKLLNPICENEGFIYPAKGLKGLYLSLAVLGKFSFKTEDMFVLSKGKINEYYFIYHFYNWFMFKRNVAGIDREAQELLTKYLYSDNIDTKNLQLSDIYKLKDAIHQDKSAIEFVVRLCRNTEGTKQALKKMQENGSAKL